MPQGDKYKLGPNKERRLARVSFVVPCCVGTFAYHLGKKAIEGGATHQWTVFLRSPTNSDLSHVIKKVAFTLHSSFAESVREISSPPYEVIERGWGEFEIGVKVFFQDDAMEAPVEVKHYLKLFECEKDMAVPNKKPVIREEYEELVFWEPTEVFHNRVKNVTPGPSPPSKEMGIESHLPHYDEQAELNHLLAARNKVAEQRAKMQAAIEAADLSAF